MATRFRKSFKIAPGVKVNLGKKGASVTVGGKGAHVTVNSQGRTTVSAGIPGTGIYETETISKGQTVAPAPAAAKKKHHAIWWIFVGWWWRPIYWVFIGWWWRLLHRNKNK